MPRLHMLRGPEPGLEISLESEIVTIGRGRNNDIIIQDNEVSREHCRLVRVLDDYEIQDLSSTNGTFVNGQEVDENGWLLSGRLILEMGDSITFEYIPTDIATGTGIPIPDSLDPTTGKTLYLIVQQDTEKQPDIYVLDRGKVAIGRETDNDIVLYEPEVSRHHIKMLLTKNGYMIEDLNTTNGTFVNNRRLMQQRLLDPNDAIRIGETVDMWYTNNLERTLQLIQGRDVDDTRTADKRKTSELTKDPDTLDTDEMPQLMQPGHGLEPGDLEKYIFMAHAREDWEQIAGQLFAYLQDSNVPVWSDQYLPLDSSNWQTAYDQALSEAMCLLAIISKESLKAPHIRRALQHFQAREKYILLLQYEDVERLPMSIAKVPAITCEPDNPKRAFRLVLAELRKLMMHPG
jgi:pSer/pThr/pTyr-binding forkhead associated (FHA) protein